MQERWCFICSRNKWSDQRSPPVCDPWSSWNQLGPLLGEAEAGKELWNINVAPASAHCKLTSPRFSYKGTWWKSLWNWCRACDLFQTFMRSSILPHWEYSHCVPVGRAPEDLGTDLPHFQVRKTTCWWRQAGGLQGHEHPLVGTVALPGASQSFPLTSSPFSASAREKIWFQNHLFILKQNTRWPLKWNVFISGEMQHFIQPETTFSFPSRRTSEPKNW